LNRFSFVIPLILLGACSADDYSSKTLSQGTKGQVDWLRDAFGQPVTRIPATPDAGPFPQVPVDPRPEMRTQKQRTDMVADMNADRSTAAKIQTSLTKADDKTRYVAFNGKAPTAQPIELTLETVSLPDGVRDNGMVDPTRLGGWSAVATVDFKEGSSELPEEADPALSQAAHLAKENLDARVIGYSASDRLVLSGKGPHESNRYLADLRARKVAEALIRLGVPANKVIVGPADEAERKSADKVEILIDY
jgi:outer membrane protein OmpA-like peptidoglycan-associated protein